MTSFYRFRSTEALLGEWKELEKQEIYFSPPAQLNDPLEGFIDLFWIGDQIVWRNLLKHYVLTLMRAYAVTKVGGEDYRPTLSRDEPVVARLALLTPEMSTMYDRICERFFAASGIDEIVPLLGECHIRLNKDSVEFVLRCLHQTAFNAVLKHFGEKGLEPAADGIVTNSASSAEASVSALKQALSGIAAEKNTITPEQVRRLFGIYSHMAKQMELVTYVRETDEHSRTWTPLWLSFTEDYVDQLHSFVSFRWYAACFVANPIHAAMWSNYADSHKGVCLQFRSTEGTSKEPTLKLNCVTGTTANRGGAQTTHGERPFAFRAITYVETLTPIDFFRSIARIPEPDIKSDWYQNERGESSTCAEDVFSDITKWRERIWGTFDTITTTKLLDWKHESEYRLILTSAIGSFTEKAERKLRYNFEDLEGIVFGIKTPVAAKKEIIDIVAAKCKAAGRTDFAFSQAYYEPSSGKIVIRPLNLLRVS